MTKPISCLTLIEISKDETPEIAARLREFVTDFGVQIFQVFPYGEKRQYKGIVVLIVAVSQAAFDWFGKIITAYAGVISMSVLDQCSTQKLLLGKSK